MLSIITCSRIARHCHAAPAGSSHLCSRTLSVTANMSRHGSTLCSPTVKKNPLPFPFSQRSHVGNLRQTLQGKGEKIRGWKPQVSTLLCPRRVGALPAEVQRKPPRPLGANTPAAVRVPRSAGAEKPPVRFAFSRLPYAEKTKKAPLTRCLSLLRICRSLSSSSCRNYRSRRRYYHHRYRRNHSRRCPDRSIPRSG